MFARDIGIDLGTASVLVYIKDKGIVLREPSVVALDKNTGKLLKVGTEAQQMLGKTPGNIVAIRPLREGVISDYDMTERMLREFIRKVAPVRVFKPRVVICVPSGITEVEERAVIDAGIQAGARRVYLIEEPLAAAIGAGVDITQPDGHMVVDIGGGTTDIAVITLGGMAGSRSLKMAGDALTAAVQRFLQEKKQLIVGENMAERIKMALGSVEPLPEPLTLDVSGKDLTSAGPRTLTLSDGDIRECLQPVVGKIVDALLDLLERTAPELSGDIMRQGILLTGGGALLRGLDARIASATGLPVRVDSDPLTTVLRGAGLTLDAPDRYGDLLIAC